LSFADKVYLYFLNQLYTLSIQLVNKKIRFFYIVQQIYE